MIDISQLKTYYALCVSESYTLAAQKLRISQSAVSHAIKKLEESVEKKLIDKSRRGFFLTTEGKILFNYCKKIFSYVERANDDLQTLSFHRMEITIGSTLEFGATVLIQQLAEFNREYKFGRIHMELHNDIFPFLMRDDVDLIIDCKLHLHDDLHSIPLFREEYVVICSPRYKKEMKIKKIQDLDRCQLISMDMDGKWWHRFYHALENEKRPLLQNIIQVNHIRGIINGTLASTGIGLVPRYTVIDELRRKKLIQLFSDVKLSEDLFSIYIKKNRMELKKNRLIIKYLQKSSGNFQTLFGAPVS